MGGRLSHFRAFWQENVSDAWALEVVQSGYALEFKQAPPPFQGIFWTPSMSPDKDQFLASEIAALLQKQAIEEVPPDLAQEGFYSRFFLVPKKGGTMRPVIDLSPLNKYIDCRGFKMETLKEVTRL